ncbi:MAG: MarR family transcriptional regulator [Gemmatimonadales bacterium]|nr:MAG: MarR family transcriptional regulator [Gemmatimonadales bacterium]
MTPRDQSEDPTTELPDGAAREASAPRNWSAEEETSLRLWVTLARSYLTLSRVVSARVLEYGLTMPQFGILEALHHLGPLSLGELAEKLLVTGGNVTYVMDRLEAQGLVERRRSRTDRRVVEAYLTPRGRALISSVFPEHAAFICDAMKHMSREEQQEMRHLLRRLGRGIAERAGEDGTL